MADEKDFKVIDRRGQDRPEPKKGAEPEQQGEGFTMKPGETPPMPDEIDFGTFLLSLATSALMYCGEEIPGVQTEKNLDLAKQNIDLLALLKTKTKGNLTPEEESLMDGLLTKVRFVFVEASKK